MSNRYIQIPEATWESVWTHYLDVIPKLRNPEDVQRYLRRARGALEGTYAPDYAVEESYVGMR